MTDDRWFRMCRDAEPYLDTDFSIDCFYFDDEGGTVSVQAESYGPGCDVRCWTVDELMDMYSWKHELELYNDPKYIKEKEPIIYVIGVMEQFNGQSWRDVWLQLVMWDKFGMTWDDGLSKWRTEADIHDEIMSRDDEASRWTT